MIHTIHMIEIVTIKWILTQHKKLKAEHKSTSETDAVKDDNDDKEMKKGKSKKKTKL